MVFSVCQWRIPSVRCASFDQIYKRLVMFDFGAANTSDTVKVRLQTKPNYYSGMANCFLRMIKEEGVLFFAISGTLSNGLQLSDLVFVSGISITSVGIWSD